MKRKKISTLIALLLGVSTFGACTNSDKKVDFGNFWIENALSTSETIEETLTYNVKYEAKDASLVNYTVNYTDGTYTTTLISQQGTDGKIVYTYTTQLNITATYTLGEATASCNDVVTSTVKFYAAEYGLQPISSVKEINASSPTAVSGSKIEDCYQSLHYTTAITYNENCSKGVATVTSYKDGAVVATDEDSFDIDQEKFSFLDNEQILFALRGIRTSTTSAKLNVYTPFAQAIQKVALSTSTETSKDESKDFTFLYNGEEVTKTITYRAFNVVLDEKNPGATQIAWIAKPSDTSSNKNHNVMLRLETPLSYGLGTLIYTLSSANYTKLN